MIKTNKLIRRCFVFVCCLLLLITPNMQVLAVVSQSEISVNFQNMLSLSSEIYIYPSDSEREHITEAAIKDILNASSTEEVVQTIKDALRSGHIYVGTEGSGRRSEEFLSWPWLVMYFFGNDRVIRVMGHLKPFDMASSNLTCQIGVGLTSEIDEWINNDGLDFHAINAFNVLALLVESGYEISTDAQTRYQSSKFDKLTPSEKDFVIGMKRALEARWMPIEDATSAKSQGSDAEQVKSLSDFVRREAAILPVLESSDNYGADFYYYAKSYVQALQAQIQASERYQKNRDFSGFSNEYIAGQVVRAIAFSWLHNFSGIEINNESGGVDYMHGEAEAWLRDLSDIVEQRKDLVPVVKLWLSMNPQTE